MKNNYGTEHDNTSSETQVSQLFFIHFLCNGDLL